jgi:hypothetical protein
VSRNSNQLMRELSVWMELVSGLFPESLGSVRSGSLAAAGAYWGISTVVLTLEQLSLIQADHRTDQTGIWSLKPPSLNTIKRRDGPTDGEVLLHARFGFSPRPTLDAMRQPFQLVTSWEHRMHAIFWKVHGTLALYTFNLNPCSCKTCSEIGIAILHNRLLCP